MKQRIHVMHKAEGLADIPLENRDGINPLKKLSTAISIESPDLFRIRGVPCIDRGPDGSNPPVPCGHWKQAGTGSSSSSNDDRAIRRSPEHVKRTANFARPSSVSADTPNMFKVSIVGRIRKCSIYDILLCQQRFPSYIYGILSLLERQPVL